MSGKRGPWRIWKFKKMDNGSFKMWNNQEKIFYDLEHNEPPMFAIQTFLHLCSGSNTDMLLH